MKSAKPLWISMVKNLSLLLSGVLLGLLAAHGLVCFKRSKAKPVSQETSAEAMPFTVTLYRFELNPDKLDRFDDWVHFEHAHHEETVATLEREKMYFEAIFRDQMHKSAIYWLAVQGKGGGHTNDSPLPIDKQYEQFMQETLKKGGRTTMTTEYFLVPPFMVKEIQAHR